MSANDIFMRRCMFFFTVCLLLVSCMKDSNETVWLPVLNDRIPERVLSSDEQDSLRQYMPIYEGFTPVNVDGEYIASPMSLVYASDGFSGLFYDMRWKIVDQNGRNVASYKEWQNNATGVTKEAHVIGEGEKVTVYTVEKAVDETLGWSCDMVTVMSGLRTDNGIKDYSYAIVMRNKRDDNGVIIEPDSYRVFSDGDGISSLLKQ